MLRYQGRTISGGSVIGPIMTIKNTEESVTKIRVRDRGKELKRLHSAAEAVREELRQLQERAEKTGGSESASVFAAHELLLEDPVFLEAIRSKIRSESVNAEYAVYSVGEKFAKMLTAAEDEYMSVRAADVRDVAQQLSDRLRGTMEGASFPESRAIVAAEELSPSQLVRLNRNNVRGLVLGRGSENSHCAILARVMNIPAIAGIGSELKELQDGITAVIDGKNGELIIDPDEDELLKIRLDIWEQESELKQLRKLIGKETRTAAGQRVRLYANVSSPEDVGIARENDAEGIGLFRSEFLYLGENHLPGEEEQFRAYKRLLQAADGKEVIIRTMDIGAEKKPDYLELQKEANPALGVRGIRASLLQPEILRVQLRALLRAAACGSLKIMYPMITSGQEVIRVQKLVQKCADELEAEGKPHRIPPQGIMIETPAAVLISDDLSGLVDFVSIGTNDLTQYTLAIDRQNDRLGAWYDPHHKAILRMIAMVVKNAHEKGIQASICGELAGDLSLTDEFVRMGIDELSVAPAQILKLRQKIMEL